MPMVNSASVARRGLPRERAAPGARAVAGAAPAVVAGEVAAGAPPDTAAGGACAELDEPRLAGVQLGTTPGRDGGRPHREGAQVGDEEGGRSGTSGVEGC